MRFRISLRGRRTVLPLLTDCFDSSQKTPQECAVIQCCYHSPDNQNFIFYRSTTHSLVEIVWLENHIVGAEAFEVMARDFCTWSTCLVRALGTFRRFPDTSRHSRKWWHGLPPYFLLVCVRVRSCAYLCAGKRKKMATTNSAEEI